MDLFPYKDGMLPRILVLVQFVAFALLLLTGPLVAVRLPMFLLELAGTLLGLWAIFSQGLGNFRIVGVPSPRGRLVTTGPYRLIRHPMYMSLLLIASAMVISAPSLLRWSVWALLALDLIGKLTLEERLLRSHYPGYAEYARKTWKLFPYLY
jgi:protein-S-isoprenylcysteine O-methyltransferase Ste14